MIALFCALEQEINLYKRNIRIKNYGSRKGFRIYEGQQGEKTVVIILTGVGKEQAGKAAEMAVREYPLSMIVTTGFAGGLNKKIKTGDVIIYNKIKCEEASNKNTILYPNYKLELNDYQISLKNGYRMLKGSGVTMTGVCATPDLKERTGIEFETDTVDMESYWISLVAARNNIPFIGIRSIFDSVEDDLTLLIEVVQNGKFAPVKVLRHLILHPAQIGIFKNYYLNSRLAGKNLAHILSYIIERN